MAALMVVVAHALPALYPFYSILGYLGHGGYAGVELFFVLSGFLIGRILLRLGNSMTQKVTVFHFWIRRWLRTLPFFFLV